MLWDQLCCTSPRGSHKVLKTLGATFRGNQIHSLLIMSRVFCHCTALQPIVFHTSTIKISQMNSDLKSLPRWSIMTSLKLPGIKVDSESKSAALDKLSCHRCCNNYFGNFINCSSPCGESLKLGMISKLYLCDVA